MCQFVVARCPCAFCTPHPGRGRVLGVNTCPQRQYALWFAVAPVPGPDPVVRPPHAVSNPATCPRAEFMWLADLAACVSRPPLPAASAAAPAPPLLPMPVPAVFVPAAARENGTLPGMGAPVAGLVRPALPAQGPFAAGAAASVALSAPAPFSAAPGLAGPSAAPSSSAPAFAGPSAAAPPAPNNMAPVRATHTANGRKLLPTSRPRTERVWRAIAAAAAAEEEAGAAAASRAAVPAAASAAASPAAEARVPAAPVAPVAPVPAEDVYSNWAHAETLTMLALRSKGMGFEEISQHLPRKDAAACEDRLKSLAGKMGYEAHI